MKNWCGFFLVFTVLPKKRTGLAKRSVKVDMERLIHEHMLDFLMTESYKSDWRF